MPLDVQPQNLWTPERIGSARKIGEVAYNPDRRRRSSVVEQPPCKRQVVCSIQTGGTNVHTLKHAHCCCPVRRQLARVGHRKDLYESEGLKTRALSARSASRRSASVLPRRPRAKPASQGHASRSLLRAKARLPHRNGYGRVREPLHLSASLRAGSLSRSCRLCLSLAAVPAVHSRASGAAVARWSRSRVAAGAYRPNGTTQSTRGLRTAAREKRYARADSSSTPAWRLRGLRKNRQPS